MRLIAATSSGVNGGARKRRSRLARYGSSSRQECPSLSFLRAIVRRRLKTRFTAGSCSARAHAADRPGAGARTVRGYRRQRAYGQVANAEVSRIGSKGVPSSFW
jgi:hypothetical protein